MRLCEGVVQLEGLERRGAGFRARLCGRRHAAIRADDVAVREPGPGRGERGIELDRAAEVAEAELDRLRRARGVGVPALQVLEMGLGVHGAASGQS